MEIATENKYLDTMIAGDIVFHQTFDNSFGTHWFYIKDLPTSAFTYKNVKFAVAQIDIMDETDSVASTYRNVYIVKDRKDLRWNLQDILDGYLLFKEKNDFFVWDESLPSYLMFANPYIGRAFLHFFNQSDLDPSEMTDQKWIDLMRANWAKLTVDKPK